MAMDFDAVLHDVAGQMSKILGHFGLTQDHELLAVPFRLATVLGPLSFFSTTTTFSAPVDITLSELTIESLFPADLATATIIRRMAEDRPLPVRQAAAG